MSLLFIGHPKETDLALFAGGELGPLARWRIERHLQQCDGCQEAVADFFHLQSEVSELAQTPAIDWKALSHNISARVRVEVPAGEEKAPAWFAHPRVWQVGLATATLLCTIVVVRQLPTVRQSDVASPRVEALDFQKESAPANQAQESQAATAPPQTSPAASQFAQTLDQAAGRANAVSESNETAASGAESPEGLVSAARNRRDETLRAEFAPERKAPTDMEAERPPAAEPLALRAANEVNAATPPPAAPALQAEADAGALQSRAPSVAPGPNVVGGVAAARSTIEAGERRKAESAEVAQAPKALAPSPRLLARQGVLEKETSASDARWTPARGFTVLPAALEDPAVDVGVAADGWISIRAVDANSGTITITDVYVP